MSRLEKVFAKLKSELRGGFIPFISAGDPSAEKTLEILTILADCGADVIELGVPFSDPMADGPVIQASSQRALKAGTDLPTIFRIVRDFRQSSEVPIVLFSYMNPLLSYGLTRLANQAAQAGIDAVLVTDVIDDAAAELSQNFRPYGIDYISLVAPTTTDERLAAICSNSSGFIYAVSRTGVTGVQSEPSSAAEKLVLRTRRFTALPIAVGFGISSAEQIAEVWRYADAAVVGSAIVAEIERSLDESDFNKRIESFVRKLVPQIAKPGQRA
ncbi:MAG: tryptophan synthase subunit alpha [Blastocatellia bacterium]